MITDVAVAVAATGGLSLGIIAGAVARVVALESRSRGLSARRLGRALWSEVWTGPSAPNDREAAAWTAEARRAAWLPGDTS